MKLKHHILFLALLLGFSVKGLAQDFKPVLTETVTAFFKAQDQSEKIAQSNKLALIAKKYDQEWAPSYYLALSKIMLNYAEEDKDKKDAYLDDADTWLNTAASLSDKEDKNQQSEIAALKAMLANARIGVDPAKRWKKYGKQFETSLETAKDLNPDNPRIYFLKGTSVFYTPKAFGGGKKRAAEYFEKAAGLFAKESHDDILKPHWGSEVNGYYIQECQKDDKDN